MALGLLDSIASLFGGSPAAPPMATRGGFAARYGGNPGGLLGFDPAEMRQQALSQALIGGGIGLMSTPGWGPGIAQGLAYANQGMREAKRDAVYDALTGRKLRAYDREEREYERDDAARARRERDLNLMETNPPGPWRDRRQEWARLVRLDPDAALDWYQPGEQQALIEYAGNMMRNSLLDKRTGELRGVGEWGPRWEPSTADGDASVWSVVDLPNGGGRAQYNARTGEYKALPNTDTSPGDVIGPIISKVARGETLTAGEQRAYDMYSRMSPLDRYVSGVLEGSLPGEAQSSPSVESVPEVPQTSTTMTPISGMGLQELLALDITSLTDGERAELDRRLTELGY